MQSLETNETHSTPRLELTSSAMTELAQLPHQTQPLLLRMFNDPRQLERGEVKTLVQDLRSCVSANPANSGLRVLLGMALCVNYEVNQAITELEEGVHLQPDSFIAQLKLGELWMRLRVVDRADQHTLAASRLASNPIQVDLARRQAAAIRELRRNGIERGGFRTPLTALRRLFQRRRPTRALAIPAEG